MSTGSTCVDAILHGESIGFDDPPSSGLSPPLFRRRNDRKKYPKARMISGRSVGFDPHRHITKLTTTRPANTIAAQIEPVMSGYKEGSSAMV